MKYLNKVSAVLPLSLKIQLITLLKRKKLKLSSNKKAFVFLAADYGNIGDIAISNAQSKFLKKQLPDFEVVNIPISQTRLVMRSIQKQLKAGDLVTIIGGGNMGNAYPDIEALRQLVIKSFPNNRIVCFPQTFDWNDSVKANLQLKRLVKTYSQHDDIHLFARETITYSKLETLFSKHPKVAVNLVPDIVMSATAEALGAKDCTAPTGILSCLRDDKEAALSADQYAKLDAALSATGYRIESTDTHAGGSQLDETYCAKLLADKLSQFRSANLVVTDRLHGMILSLLAGTPCLVVPNSNHKISQTWSDWLQDHPRIIFADHDQFADIDSAINKLLSEPHGSLNQAPVASNKYHKLKEALVAI